MVQTISLNDTKEISSQNTKSVKTDSNSNVDFLELLMNDMKLDKDSTSDTKKSLTSDDDKSDKKDILKELEDKLSLKDLSDNKNIKSLMDSNPQIKDDIVKEVKNILDSQMKQNNILLSKSDEKEFKSIDNLKDLINFSDKKGLNIKKLKVELPKETKQSLQDLDIQQNKPKEKQELKIPHLDTKNILEKKKASTNINTKPINQETKSNTQTISLVDILNKKPKSANNIPDKEIKTDTKVSSQINLTDLLKSKDTKNISDKEIKTDIKSIIDKKDKKDIQLTDLLNPNSDKVDKKPVKKIDNDSNDNINLQQSSVNEIKARSVQAKQTIESFKNNLDDAIKNYKPPISKVDIELNPKNLGKVEVSIVQRGNNIQVHMNTDQSNVAMFQTHQAEFRQALANIGFSNIDMSFNSNQDKERRENQAKKTYEDNEKIEDISDIEINANYQYA